MTTKDEALQMALDIPMSEVQLYAPEKTTTCKRNLTCGVYVMK